MEETRKAIAQLQNKIKDILDKPDSGAARQLQKEVQAIEDDLQVGRNARAIEDRVKRVVNLLENQAEHERIMNYEHIAWLIKQFEHIRESLRKLY